MSRVVEHNCSMCSHHLSERLGWTGRLAPGLLDGTFDLIEHETKQGDDDVFFGVKVVIDRLPGYSK